MHTIYAMADSYCGWREKRGGRRDKGDGEGVEEKGEEGKGEWNGEGRGQPLVHPS